MKHFNGLTPAEAERLALLLEELGEAQQAIGKILRHGYESRSPYGGPSNRNALILELGDVQFAIKLLCESGDLEELHIADRIVEKLSTVTQYLHHQPATDQENRDG